LRRSPAGRIIETSIRTRVRAIGRRHASSGLPGISAFRITQGRRDTNVFHPPPSCIAETGTAGPHASPDRGIRTSALPSLTISPREAAVRIVPNRSVIDALSLVTIRS
jgi:hypothetical protein